MNKKLYIASLVAAAVLAGCTQKSNGTLDDILLARQTLTSAEAYYYAEAAEDGTISYGASADVRKLTVAFTSENLAYNFASSAFSGEGQYFEIEFCVPVDSQSLAVGHYTGGDIAPWHINLANTTAAAVNNSTPTAQNPSGIDVEVSKEGDIYTIDINFTNSWGAKLYGTYTGALSFKPYTAYSEPTDSTTFVISEVEDITFEADAQNDLYWAYYGTTLHTVTLTDAAGNEVVIQLEAADENAIESLPSGEWEDVYEGYWTMSDPFTGFYRSGSAETSYLLTADGHYYYLTPTSPLTVAFDADDNLTSLSFEATTAFGSTLTIALN